MALNHVWSNDLFSAPWVNNLKGSVERSMVASVRFYDPQTSEAVYDPATNTYTSVPTELLTCQARVQPLRSASAQNTPGDTTTVQTVLVSIPIDVGRNLDLRPHHRLQVLSAPLFPVLLNYVFVAKEVVDSSNPFERTFAFEVNQETVQS